MRSKDLHQKEAYRFHLPPSQIAQYPQERREESRLMVVHKKSGLIEERTFCEIGDYLDQGDQIVLNNTKVLPARLRGKRPNGGVAEALLLHPLEDGSWEAMCRPGKKLPPGTEISISADLSLTILRDAKEGLKTVRLNSSLPLEEALNLYGEMPLPPYIRKGKAEESDKERYQTVYAQELGAVAAPTAGLHFSLPLLEQLKQKGVSTHPLTLHVGPGTFRPVQEEDIRHHPMHHEWYNIPPDTAHALNAPQGKQIAVGTTCCRTLESASTSQGELMAGAASTNLFIYPGYAFKKVEHLLTNFHLPESTLLMLVSALAGYDLMMEAYEKAVKEGYRFFSYGDAMLIL